jgi:two-component system, NarL family, sensor histidine kinase DevS
MDELQERRERELNNLRSENEHLRRRVVLLSELGRRIASSLDPDKVLQDVVDSACELTDARYGALGVFDAERRVEQFITHGITDEERAAIGGLPEGLGILGWLQDLQEPLRLGDLTSHPRSVGFPANHPSMKTFLGAPVRHGSDALGNIYLTEKNNGADFTPEDENLLVLFAAQAAMAIRNAQLHAQVQDLVVLEERERIGMDLHDGVIQSLYATGLKLESCLDDLVAHPEAVRPELENVIDQVNNVMADIRSYIFRLRPGVLADADLAGAIGGLLRDLQVNALTQVNLVEERGVCKELSEQQTNDLFLVAQEALTNVRKHARATEVTAHLGKQGDRFTMTIVDNGVGFDPAATTRGLGLRNMKERVERLCGTVHIVPNNGQGSRVVAEIPLHRGT